jgi:hypothetical protein
VQPGRSNSVIAAVVTEVAEERAARYDRRGLDGGDDVELGVVSYRG